MKLQEKLLDALNTQIKEEVASAYLYFAMASDFAHKNRTGMAGWMRVQAHEELSHAIRIFEHINDRGGRVVLEAIDAPAEEWENPKAAFQAALKHEQYITSCIDKLVKLARDLNDNATEIFLQWFVSEQVEEEKSTGEIVGWLDQIGDSEQALFMVDRELGKRGET